MTNKLFGAIQIQGDYYGLLLVKTFSTSPELLRVKSPDLPEMFF